MGEAAAENERLKRAGPAELAYESNDAGRRVSPSELDKVYDHQLDRDFAALDEPDPMYRFLARWRRGLRTLAELLAFLAGLALTAASPLAITFLYRAKAANPTRDVNLAFAAVLVMVASIIAWTVFEGAKIVINKLLEHRIRKSKLDRFVRQLKKREALVRSREENESRFDYYNQSRHYRDLVRLIEQGQRRSSGLHGKASAGRRSAALLGKKRR